MTIHSFNIEVANAVGVNAATIYQNIQFWCEKNKANNTNFKDGNWWVYNSVKAWGKLFPYMTTRNIRTAIQKLIDHGLIEKGSYNDKTYDKTAWYAICQNRQMDLSETANGFVNNDKPIPVSKPDGNPVKDNDSSSEQSYPLELVERGFNHFWKVWGESKKRIGVKNTSPKGKTLEKKWMKMFNQAYFKKHSEQEFKDEVTSICKLVKSAHAIEGFNRFINMQTMAFLEEKQWRD